MAKSNGYSGSYTLAFEKPVIDLEVQIEELEKRADAANYADELKSLQASRDSLLAKLYADLNPWDTVRVAPEKAVLACSSAVREWDATEVDFRSFSGPLPPVPAHALVISAQQTVDRDPEQLLMHNELGAAHRPCGRSGTARARSPRGAGFPPPCPAERRRRRVVRRAEVQLAAKHAAVAARYVPWERRAARRSRSPTSTRCASGCPSSAASGSA
jgi:hypothetical protein